MSHRIKPSLALCMIAQNEERWIARAISSVRELVSEIIVVDTGSSDQTVSISRALGAKVIEQPWSDDFSIARNATLKSADSDWILVLDADEAIAAEDILKLEQLLGDQSCCYSLIQRHYTDNPQVQGFHVRDGRYVEWARNFAGYFESECVRLFPNCREIQFEGIVHELVEPSIQRCPELKIIATDIRIQHYGHTSEVLQLKDKARLYTALAIKKSQDKDGGWRAYYELGIEQIGNKALAESVASLEKSARLKSDHPLTWVNLGYALCELGRLDHARRALDRALQLEPTLPEAHCNLGVVYMRGAKFQEAVTCFAHAIDYNPEYMNAFCNLGRTLIALGELKDAGACFTRALELCPQNGTTIVELAQVYLLAGAPNEALRYAAEALKIIPLSPQAHYIIGHSQRCLGRVQDAISSLSQAQQIIEASPDQFPSSLARGIKDDLLALTQQQPE